MWKSFSGDAKISQVFDQVFRDKYELLAEAGLVISIGNIEVSIRMGNRPKEVPFFKS